MIQSILTKPLLLHRKAIGRGGSVYILLSKTQLTRIKRLKTLTTLANTFLILAKRLKRNGSKSTRILHRSLSTATRLKSLNNTKIYALTKQQKSRLRMIRSGRTLLLITGRSTHLYTGLNRDNSQHIISRSIRIKRILHNERGLVPTLKHSLTKTGNLRKGRQMHQRRSLHRLLSTRLRQRRTRHNTKLHRLGNRIRDGQHLTSTESNTSSSRLTYTRTRRRTIRNQRTHLSTSKLTVLLNGATGLIVRHRRNVLRPSMKHLSISIHGIRGRLLNHLSGFLNIL